nr:hypothetical protein [uncultured Methanospirillum sp.]
MFPRVDRACGIDVHRLRLTATIIDSLGNAITKEFSIQIQSLIELRGWIIEETCERILMEATGIYWHPVYAILEGDIPTFVANPFFLKFSPTSKTENQIQFGLPRFAWKDIFEHCMFQRKKFVSIVIYVVNIAV